ncbi:nucleotide exchange factor GrpE [Halobaculum sp. CBA1158]|uniref:nucleotide exchange factor GrpE n=1 Tax=Halobaculum sp. CBA1158 TaxID=2904243 RepID=UPI001F41A484|nr:nucleotide exchange factor GrpE [Halobaculum sp. CBA1158]UIO98957.1 nucleotide exchange factor GrpE [Halobaculum sp. CBA1158]
MSEEADAGRDDSEDASDAAGDAPAGTEAESTDRDGDDVIETALADEVARYDDALAADVAALEREAVESAERVEELESSLRRTKADFQNYKKRAKKRQEQEKARATESLVGRLTEVRDNLVRALDQDEDADIRPGVESTLETFDRVLAEENVEIIDPEPGQVVDPERHEVMMRVDSDRPEGTVVDVFKQGYEMADRVIEAAQITVSDGE